MTVAAPEPMTLALFGLRLAGLTAARRHEMRRAG
ncbi:PEP-CTERM sorting domain-containing protein [Roseomonas sp. AR75]|nr:PEP-CTERM sorting domain-containing protein [Roseomonas sp. AR75]